MTQIVPFDPFSELQALQRSFLGDDWMTSMKQMRIPTTDVYTEDDKQLVVEAHLPNFSDEDIDVHVDGNALVIRAEKHEQEQDKTKRYVVRESSSSFYRRIKLPKIADVEKIDADIKDGVLKVLVPFKELPQPKKITIKSRATKK